MHATFRFDRGPPAARKLHNIQSLAQKIMAVARLMIKRYASALTPIARPLGIGLAGNRKRPRPAPNHRSRVLQ
jgi:hypothetical protein